MAQNFQVPDQIKKPTPLYAVVGASDAVVKKIRGIDIDPDTVRSQVNDLPTKAQATATKAQAKASERFSTVVDDVKHLPDQLKTLPDKAQAFALQAMSKATEAYAEFAVRGEVVVQRVRMEGPQVIGSTVGETATDTTKKATKSTSTTAKSATPTKKSTSRTKKSTDSTD